MCSKRELRNHIRNIKRQFTKQQLEELSLEIINRIKTNPQFNKARTILLYCSLPDEVETHELIDFACKEGKQILLPKVIGNTIMEIRKYTGRKDMIAGAYKIMEPTGDIFTDYDSIELAIIPGMAFDTQGNRLGRGKGYYDRFLEKIPGTYKIGLCFHFQILDNIPTEHTDIKMNEVLTDG
ncbi:5-formyltetrahydrofolate cyclo-ligase [Xylanibacter muris]|uniref:5-formyltetrahydrofolate cyclo-ligase n=1 Tax=Xylanibacter muris TaxID=2736290 RepID=A0ABX2AN67_9BACT|nr:5-formyltetrahydrofolate cyclo-ligase [Xylanibacter muris]NPD92678.1 5-formyltetrahydrofolate cyclo-ligase [Xylanibacter muris]